MILYHASENSRKMTKFLDELSFCIESLFTAYRPTTVFLSPASGAGPRRSPPHHCLCLRLYPHLPPVRIRAKTTVKTKGGNALRSRQCRHFRPFRLVGIDKPPPSQVTDTATNAGIPGPKTTDSRTGALFRPQPCLSPLAPSNLAIAIRPAINTIGFPVAKRG